MFHSTSLLLLSNHTMSIPAWYHLLFIYLLLFACAYNTIFNAWFWFGFIDTRMLIFARHLAFASPVAGEFWLLWILMSMSRSLERVDSPNCWPEMRSGSMDHRQTVQSPIFQGPPYSALEFSCDDSEPPFLLFILVHLLVFSYLRLSVM